MSRYFTVKKLGDHWFFIDPDGKPFYSLGVDCVVCYIGQSKNRIIEKYGGDRDWFKKWASQKLKDLNDMGFNTLGAWHDKYYWSCNVPKTIELKMTKYSKKVNHVWGVGFPDVFDDSFESSVYTVMTEFFDRETGNPLKDNRSVIGYFTDNELHWWGRVGEWGKDDQGAGRNSTALVDDYIRLPHDASGKKAWVSFLRNKHKTIEELNRVWQSEYSSFEDLLWAKQYRAENSAFIADKTEFLEIIAEKYFSTTSSILNEYAPGQLNLGCRLVGVSAPDVVLKVMAKYVDVASLNFYSMKFPADYLDHVYELTQKPIMITEFSFCTGSDYGFVRNTNGAQNVIVKNQTRRAEAYEAFVTDAFNRPYMVGTHWFALYDYHSEGEGLRGNYGLYDRYDNPWQEFIAGVKRTNLMILDQMKNVKDSE